MMDGIRATLAALALALAGSTAQADDTTGTVPRSPARILTLGDSYTIGEGVATDERWPEVLAEMLESRGTPAEVRIVARTGWTTAQLTRAIERATLSPPYDLVTLLIGVNDQFQGFEEDAYPERFQALLERAIELAGGDRRRVLVVSIPDYGVTPFGQRYGGDAISRALDGYNRINQELAARAGIAHVDITAISREATRDGALIARDGLHPSGKMYLRWVERILPAAERALASEPRPTP